MIVELLFGILFLSLGADYLVKTCSRLASSLGASPFLVSMTIIAYGTSIPELLVSVGASLQGRPEITAGNIVGSTIFNSSLILGLGLLICPTICEKDLRYKDAPFMLFCSLLLFLGAYLPSFTWVHGAGFLSLLAIYIYFSVKRSPENSPEKQPLTKEKKQMYLLLPCSFFLLLYGAHIFLAGAIKFANMLQLPGVFTGLTVAAIGTSLPELATTIVAAFRKKTMILIGGIVGSNIFNTLGILGIVSTIRPISMNDVPFLDYVFMLILHVSFCFLLQIKARLGKAFGLLLFCSYWIYLGGIIWLNKT